MTENSAKIFVSWSKSQAAAIAPILKDFLEDVLGISDIFLSHHIDSGRRWSSEISSALESCQAGILVVTTENRFAPWLHFEAGALSKNVDVANVIPMLWDVSVGDIRETPLNQFQSKSFKQADVQAVCQTLGRIAGVKDETVARRFDTNWPKLEERLSNVGAARPATSIEPTIQDLFTLVEQLAGRMASFEAATRSQLAASASILATTARSNGVLNELTVDPDRAWSSSALRHFNKSVLQRLAETGRLSDIAQSVVADTDRSAHSGVDEIDIETSNKDQ